MEQNMTFNQPILRYEHQELKETTDDYVTEFPITIMVNGEEFATIICSPKNLKNLF